VPAGRIVLPFESYTTPPATQVVGSNARSAALSTIHSSTESSIDLADSCTISSVGSSTLGVSICLIYGPWPHLRCTADR
jgi:hypothetical protein